MKKKNNIYLSNLDTEDIPNGFELVSVEQFDKLDDDSVDEIFVKDFLGMILEKNISKFLDGLQSKLKASGFIHLQDIDIEQFCLYIANKVIPIETKNILHINRINTWYMSLITQYISTMSNMKICQMNYVNGYEFYVKIQKK